MSDLNRLLVAKIVGDIAANVSMVERLSASSATHSASASALVNKAAFLRALVNEWTDKVLNLDFKFTDHQTELFLHSADSVDSRGDFSQFQMSDRPVTTKVSAAKYFATKMIGDRDEAPIGFFANMHTHFGEGMVVISTEGYTWDGDAPAQPLMWVYRMDNVVVHVKFKVKSGGREHGFHDSIRLYGAVNSKVVAVGEGV